MIVVFDCALYCREAPAYSLPRHLPLDVAESVGVKFRLVQNSPSVVRRFSLSKVINYPKEKQHVETSRIALLCGIDCDRCAGAASGR